MSRKILKGLALLMLCLLAAVGCSTQQPPATTPPATTTPAGPSNADIVSKGIYRFGPPMMGVSDSFDNMYYAAKGGNWALSSYMGDVIGDFMEPTQLTKPQLYSQWTGFYKANLDDGTAIRKAMDAQDMGAFEKAYSDIMTNMCNACHASNGFSFIKKIKAAAPAVDLDYTVKSKASDNK